MLGKSFRVAWYPVFAAAGLLLSHAASAQGWVPQRNVEFVVPAGPGSSLDNNVRLIQKLSSEFKLLPVPGTVVNRAGGEHLLAYNYVRQRAGDPHYLSLATSVLLTSHISGRSSITYTDVTPVATLSTEWTFAAVRVESPLKTGRDLIEVLMKDPASLSLGYASTTHRIAAVLPMRTAEVDIKRVRMVVFEGGKTGIMLLGGHTDVALSTYSQVVPHVESGKLRVIAVNSPQRLGGVLASVPTWEELGYKSGSGSWRGIIAPKGITSQQVAYWEGVLRRVVESDEFRRDVENNNGHVTFRGAAETRSFMEAEYNELKSAMAYLGLAKH